MELLDGLIRNIDQVCKLNYPADEPGAAILVGKDGIPIFRKGYGMANLELCVSIEPEMVFRLGSITKQFTSLGILMLVERGKLSLDIPITDFLPDYPTQGRNITIHHLLCHTSGIPSYTSLPGYELLNRVDMSSQELVDLFKEKPLQFTPGTQFSYSNSGYALLGFIIEQITGEKYSHFIQHHIFQQLGLKNSSYDQSEKIIFHRVPGYKKKNNIYCNSDYISTTQPYSAGGLMSNVDDLLLWDSALYTEKLVGSQSLELLFTPKRLEDGTQLNYGYGWETGKYKGSPLQKHEGHISGFASCALRLPEKRLYVALLSNNASKWKVPNRLAADIMKLVV